MNLGRFVVYFFASIISTSVHGQLFRPLELGDAMCGQVGPFSRPTMHIEDDILYVCTKQGLYSKSLSDDASGWQLVGFKNIPLQDYVRSGEDLLALQYSTTDEFLLLSHDGGKTYEDITPDLFKGYNWGPHVLKRFYQSPTDANCLFVSSSVMGLLKSSDFGRTWTQVTDAILGDSEVSFHPLNPNIICISGENIGMQPFFDISYDGGNTWKNISPESNGENIAGKVAFHPNISDQWICGTFGAVYKSSDNGYTWILQDFSDYAVNSFSAFWHYAMYDDGNPDVIYMAGDAEPVRLMCSTDGGKSWNIPRNCPSQGRINDFLQYRDKLLLFTESDVYEISKEELRTDAYRQLAVEGKKWQVDGMNYRIAGDTIIGDEPWKKLCSNYPLGGDHDAFLAAMRQEGDKVYAIFNGEDKRRLLYNFGLQVGDRVRTIIQAWPTILVLLEADEEYEGTVQEITLTDIDTIDVCGQELRRFTFKTDSQLKAPSRAGGDGSYKNFVWVEGVGSERGLLKSWCTIHDEGTMDCCTLDGNIIFRYEDFHKESILTAIHDISASEIVNGKSSKGKSLNSKSLNGQWYDLTGRQIRNGQWTMDNVPRGVYVRDGKKVAVRRSR